MKLLAIDTATEIASVALLVDGKISCEEQGSQKTHAQLLLPMIERLLVDAGLSVNALDGVIFGCGPGSFTGLRIACSIAKGLAYAHDLRLFPVSTLGAIAFSARQIKGDVPVLAVLDARMQEMYWNYFAPSDWLGINKVDAVQDIKLPDEQNIVLAGVGIDGYWSDFPAQVKSQINDKLLQYPNAAAMIGLAQVAAIQPVSVAEAQPIYVRNQVTQGGSRG